MGLTEILLTIFIVLLLIGIYMLFSLYRGIKRIYTVGHLYVSTDEEPRIEISDEATEAVKELKDGDLALFIVRKTYTA